LLAGEGFVHTDKDHQWHMQILGKLARGRPELLLATPFKVVNLNRAGSGVWSRGLVAGVDGRGPVKEWF